MENLLIDETNKTPSVNFNSKTGKLCLEGISIPENTVDFYHTLVYWISEYGRDPLPETILDIKLEYFNTSTSVVLLNLFKILTDLDKTELTINWYYESDDTEMEEVGKDYKNMTSVSFNLIAIDSF